MYLIGLPIHNKGSAEALPLLCIYECFEGEEVYS